MNSSGDCRKTTKLFVVGMWRSGTSLMYALLNQHPQVALLYEGDLLVLRPMFWGRSSGQWIARWEFWNHAVSRHGIREARLCGCESRIDRAAECAYEEYAAHKTATVCGEKSPNYYDRMWRLSRMFPEARFLIVWRDPVGVCESVKRAAQEEDSWFSRKGMMLRALLGCRVLRRERDRLVKSGVMVHEVQYEHLVADPATETARICEFLNVPFSTEMASLKGADRSAIYVAEHHARVRSGEISPTNREEILPQALKQKAARYIRMWRRQSGGSWPFDSASLDSSTREPGLWERLCDTVAYRALRAWDEFVITIYCFAPLGMLTKFRETKGRGQRKLVAE